MPKCTCKPRGIPALGKFAFDSRRPNNDKRILGERKKTSTKLYPCDGRLSTRVTPASSKSISIPASASGSVLNTGCSSLYSNTDNNGLLPTSASIPVQQVKYYIIASAQWVSPLGSGEDLGHGIFPTRPRFPKLTFHCYDFQAFYIRT